MGNFTVEPCKVEVAEVDYDKYVFIGFKFNTVSFRQAVDTKSWKHLVFIGFETHLAMQPKVIWNSRCGPGWPQTCDSPSGLSTEC